MGIYCGIDLHCNNLVLAMVNEAGKEKGKVKLRNDLGQALKVLEEMEEPVLEIGVESTCNWHWPVDGLQQTGWPVKLANPAAMKQYEGLKHVGDGEEAYWIARQLQLGILPEGYIYPREKRSVRDLLRKRVLLVKHRTAHLISMSNIWARETIRRVSGKRVYEMEVEELSKDLKDPRVVQALASSRRVIELLREEISKVEGAVRGGIRLEPECQLLRTVYGVGKLLGMTIALETGEIRRFKKVGNYASYCRCVKSEYWSNGKKKGAGNRKNGNRYLAWAYQEAAHSACRHYQRARLFYERKARQRNPFVAWKALAHKLCRASYFVMRDQVEFSADRLFG